MAANTRRSWYLDSSSFELLEDKMRQIPNRSEKVMNNYLHSKGIELAQDNIQAYIPVSHWKGRVRNKRHARDSKALKGQGENLGFIIRPKPKFNYIKYPDLGIGQSQRNEPELFMDRGLAKAVPTLVKDLSEELIKEIDKTLGGK